MKLIFLDIDGTLTVAGENTPPDSALKAIRKAQEAGSCGRCETDPAVRLPGDWLYHQPCFPANPE